ncbi:LysR family transcriptional regulator [Azoarcus sp. L1K30]|uniref:LysR family transcriptional regulator n=1 Tax=Azoarcus sp. L1K30 TaxID=2820277 RepID=UPI001B824960|nr:LysR family transcriptional regulator [Azoarcus sp. L1K30]MBR0567581.1 LysR family transcriptional regulator [Azoarcus sp. L1K30]
MSRSLLRDLPLLELLALEASVRLGSLTLAAEELSLTPSAISHRIRQAEHSLGLKLLERQGRHMVATPAGQACHDELTRLVFAFREATQTLRTRVRQRVHLDVTPVLGAHWLPQQLPVLRTRLGAPELGFELSTSRLPDAAPSTEADIVIEFSPTSPHGDAHTLFAGHVGIYLAGGSPLRAPVSATELACHDLVCHKGADWSQWIHHAYGHCPPLRYSVTVDDPLSAVEACIGGAGPVLLTTLAAQPHLESGRIRRGHPAMFEAGHYWLTLTARGMLQPLARRTADHLVTLAAAGT